MTVHLVIRVGIGLGLGLGSTYQKQEARCKVCLLEARGEVCDKVWAMGGETGDGETCVRCRSTVDVPRQVWVVWLG